MSAWTAMSRQQRSSKPRASKGETLHVDVISKSESGRSGSVGRLRLGGSSVSRPGVDHLDPKVLEIPLIPGCNASPPTAGDSCNLAVGVADRHAGGLALRAAPMVANERAAARSKGNTRRPSSSSSILSSSAASRVRRRPSGQYADPVVELRFGDHGDVDRAVLLASSQATTVGSGVRNGPLCDSGQC